ncbi:hypothetical protein [Paraburkholderia sp. A3RO-2L]|uniref:hypothetical protein n=1 Tax=Paraburkholderia sp. A3RO-2L TaxID=3028376 RepID=UPI003DA8ED59
MLNSTRRNINIFRNQFILDNSELPPGVFFILPLLAAILVVIMFLWEGHIGLGLADESYLWYGAQRILHGEVPIRDFMAYDPMRYYWVAAWMAIVGNHGIVAARVAVAIFEFVGLAAGLLVVARAGRSMDVGFYIIAGIVLIAWMYPRHKLFDTSLSILLVAALCELIRRPRHLGYFLAGCVVGATATFGRNHGVYGVAGMLLGMAYIAVVKREGVAQFKNIGFWVSGIVVGYLPILLMCVFVPGFAHAFVESVLFLFQIKGTNLALPVPWPWTVVGDGQAFWPIASEYLIGLLFISLVVIGVAGALFVMFRAIRGLPVSAPLVASVCFILPYAQYAFSRAEINHLAQGIFPLMLALLCFMAGRGTAVRWGGALVLLVASMVVMLRVQPGWGCSRSGTCVEAEIGNDRLLLDPTTNADVKLLKSLRDKYASDGSQFVVTPFWPGAYAIFDKKNPLWEIYALWPSRTVAFQKAQIREIEQANPSFVLVVDTALDGRDELRFENTHPVTFDYIKQTFTRINVQGTGQDYLVFEKRR